MKRAITRTQAVAHVHGYRRISQDWPWILVVVAAYVALFAIGDGVETLILVFCPAFVTVDAALDWFEAGGFVRPTEVGMTYEEFAAQKRMTAPPVGALHPGRPVFIYALGDPETGLIRYIGKSIRPVERLQNHCNEPATNCHRSHWIQSLKKKGLCPLMVIVEEIRGEWPWQEAEKYWIARGRAEGWPLTNNTLGGDGVEGLPQEARDRMSATWRGRKHKPETIEKLKAARALRPHHSAETRAKMSAAQTGRKITWRAQIAEANRKFDPERLAEAKRRLDAGERTTDLAREYGVHRTTISKIKTGTYVV